MMTETTAPTTTRPATAQDLTVLVEMTCRFVDTTAYRTRVLTQRDHFRDTAQFLIDHGLMLVAEQDGIVIGMVGALVITHPLLNVRAGTELIWWVEPQARRSGVGRRLFDEAEQWARQQGAALMQFTAYQDATLERLYRSYGYVAKEVVFEKDLNL